MSSSRILYKQCPLCGSAAHAEHARADCSQHPAYHAAIDPIMVWRRCSACGHTFTEGYFTREAAALVFATTHPAQAVGADMENQRVVSARMIDKVLPFATSGAWLDVGFGNASLLFTAQEFGFVPEGVDLRQTNVDALQAFGITGHCVNLLAVNRPGAFKVISMADVLEHVPHPIPFLHKAHSLLADDGVLFISMPNADAPLWHAWNRAGSNPYWGELEHYHNFGQQRLYALLADTGFVPLRYGISERYRCCMEVVAAKR